ncbi:peptidoglycan DD-metalloendopeptidase family protein [Methylobacillus sp.]|uniref:peptidoglycan DD-metalloendopeptidase family protein n=1 Tax=Methylobacillus sp. TaxID=56818 RepID=UPI0012CF6D3A|nr:peptidoglycan DD-metalloendopeptidase family protein [Methylobacillus sp.]MPS48675.1 LysM peptidoglycan-binding domain-containing protein [Methylobacillus sp.]
MQWTKQVNKSWLVSLFLIGLAGCSTTEHAPVVDRAPAAKPPVATQSKPSAGQQSSDWRPNTHTVKKGDTLYSIGLEYGFDYKEIAQLNNIAPPAYTIHIGQQLNLPARTADAAPAASPIPGQPASIADGDVIITPLNLDGGSGPATVTDQTGTATPAPGQPLLVVEPKALRQPYSEAALNAPVPAPQPQVAAAPAAATPATATPSTPTAAPAQAAAAAASSATNSIEGIDWAWPTNGKVIAGFNDSASTKGLDIGGTMGQPVHAAAPGKVIYSGSDLRGYGKLVIIKHNNTFLSVYAHNSNILVKEGQQVTRGQKIAEMGDSDTDKVKLHFEIRRQGKSVDPSKYLPSSPG